MKLTNYNPFMSFMNQMTEMEKSAQKMITLVQPALADSLAKYDKMVKRFYGDDIKILVKSIPQIDFANSIAPALEAMSRSMATVNQFANIDSLCSALSSAATAISDVSWYSDLDFAIPILEEELKDEPEPIKEIPHSIKERKPLTFEQLCTLLGIILSLITVLIALLPNPQLEEISQQQEVLIEQGNTQIEQNNRIIELLEQQVSEKNEIDLEHFVEGLANAGSSIASEIQTHISQEAAEQSQNTFDIADDLTDNSEDFSDPHIDQPESNPHKKTNRQGG